MSRPTLPPAEAYLAAIVASSDDAIIAHDLDGRITLWNAPAERLLGYSAAQAVGTPTLMLFPADRHDEEVDTLMRVWKGEDLSHFETVLVARDGTRIEVSLTISPILNASGQVIGASKIARDITKHKQLLKSQREAQAREETARRQLFEVENRRIQDGSRLKGEFVANMSHELRTPLNSIIGFAEIMADERLGPMPLKYAGFSGLILKSAEHLLHLINDILDLAKVESGKIDLKPERVRLAAVVDDVTSIAAALARQRDIRIDASVDPELHDIHLDATRFRQVLYNYLSNAIKFSREHSRVEVRVRADGSDYFIVEVQDWGIGIKPADLDRLFIEFLQLDAGTAKHYQGTGLGLAITKRIVEAQGGSVGVRAEAGVGSTFYARLPRHITARTADVTSTSVSLNEGR